MLLLGGCRYEAHFRTGIITTATVRLNAEIMWGTFALDPLCLARQRYLGKGIIFFYFPWSSWHKINYIWIIADSWDTCLFTFNTLKLSPPPAASMKYPAEKNTLILQQVVCFKYSVSKACQFLQILILSKSLKCQAFERRAFQENSMLRKATLSSSTVSTNL